VAKSLWVAVLLLCQNGSALAAPVFWSDKGSYYEVVQSSGVNWLDAKAAAEGLTYQGRSGHLVTITSRNEGLWLTSTFGSNGLHLRWIGAFQAPSSNEPAGGWSWVTGETWSYTNWWLGGEPNNSGGRENTAVFDHGVSAGRKSWNDLNQDATYVPGYVVEYSSTQGPGPSPVPEPAGVVLICTGLAGLVARVLVGRAWSFMRQNSAQ